MGEVIKGYERAASLAVGRSEAWLSVAAACARETPRCAVTAVTPAQLSSSRMRGVLSPREREVLHALAAGASQGEMSTQLGVKQTTVSAHLMRLYRRLGVSGPDVRVAAIAQARRFGLLS